MGVGFDPGLLLDKPLMASLATASPDGPRLTPVWFLWEDGALWVPGDAGSHFVIRAAADPRVALDIVDHDNAAGRLLHLGYRGRATVSAQDVAGRFRRLLAKYLGSDPTGWNPWFVAHIARPDDPTTRFLRIAPSGTFTNNVSYFRTGPGLAAP
jgi:hypothetical protein